MVLVPEAKADKIRSAAAPLFFIIQRTGPDAVTEILQV